LLDSLLQEIPYGEKYGEYLLAELLVKAPLLVLLLSSASSLSPPTP